MSTPCYEQERKRKSRTSASRAASHSIHGIERQAEPQAILRSLSHISAVADILEVPRVMINILGSEIFDETL